MKRKFTIEGEPIEVDIITSTYQGELGIHYGRNLSTRDLVYVLALGNEKPGELLTWGLISVAYPWAVKILKAPSAEDLNALTPQQQAVLSVIPSGDLGVERFKYEMQSKFQMTDGAIGKVFKNLLRMRLIEYCEGSKLLFRITVRGTELQMQVRERDEGIAVDYVDLDEDS